MPDENPDPDSGALAAQRSGIAIGMVVLTGTLAVFFLSLLRLHRQMVVVKASELALARELYAESPVPASRGHRQRQGDCAAVRAPR
jgi:hypothetical protein